MSGHNPPLVFIIAGEPSGDVLGARLMAALKERAGKQIAFAGVGGPLMAEEGLASLFPMSDLSLMGLIEIVPHIPKLLRRMDYCVAEIRKSRPSVLITIDSPGFNFRVARRLKGFGVPLVHYVAPSVWAWRPGRARKIAAFLDHLLALLPFEPPYFEKAGLPCTFVGHPVLEMGGGDGTAFRRRHGLCANDILLTLLPGSRLGEVKRLLPVFGHAVQLLSVELLAKSSSNLIAAIPVVEGVRGIVAAAAAKWPVRSIIVEGVNEKFDAFAASNAALAASGTVSLELAMSGAPMVIAYKVNPLSAWLARRLIRVKFVSLVNIVLNRLATPEFLQHDCRPEPLAKAVLHLLDDAGARAAQKALVDEALRIMGRGGPSPSIRAAEAVLKIINDGVRR